MRVAYVLQRFPYLTETFVAEEIAAILRRGVEVTIVPLFDPDARPIQPTSARLLRHVRQVPSFRSYRLWGFAFLEFITHPGVWLRGLAELMRASRPNGSRESLVKRLGLWCKALCAARELRAVAPDRIHSHFAWLPGAGGLLIARALGRPLSVTVHAYDLFARDDLLDWVAAESNDVVAISEFNRAWVSSRVRSAKISVIRCGIDLRRYGELVGRRRTERSRPGDSLRVVSVGSLVPKKGHADLIRAIAQARDEGLSISLSILGGGPLEATLREQILEAGLDSLVELKGAVAEHAVLEELVHSDVFALAAVVAPSGDRDGIPVALMEAGYLGLPLVSTDVSGIPELVVDGVTGRLVPSEDWRRLAKVLRELAIDVAGRERLGAQARTMVERLHNVEDTSHQLIRLWGAIAPDR